jgi:dTMP kinase
MLKNTFPGKFIVFDSLDGSGQSTQMSLLRDFLVQKRINVLTTKEPTTDSEAGRKIREILQKKIKSGSEDLQELFTQDRKEHLEKIIILALKSEKWVISDRYFFSTFAYGASDGLDVEHLINLNNNFLLPDETFILKVSPKTCMERIQKRGTKQELFEKEEKLAKVWQAYEKFPARFENVNIIEGERPAEEVFEDVKKIISKLL